MVGIGGRVCDGIPTLANHDTEDCAGTGTTKSLTRQSSTAWWNAAFALALAVVLVARCVAIVDALRSPEPVATAFDEDAYYAFAVTFSPWVVYNYRLTGTILPQGGLATSVGADGSALDRFRVSAATRAVLELTAPPLVPAVARMPTWYLAACAVVLCAGFTRVCRHNAQAKRMARSTAWLASGAAALVVYYLLFSRATWMYPRYFMPIRLLALGAWLWLALDALGTLRAWRVPFVAALLLAAVATSMVRAVHSFGSSTPYMGEELRLLIANGLCSGPARVGMFDSGHIGYRCAPYVVNLDGKASLAALSALADGRLLAHLAAFQIDRLFLLDANVILFDRVYPQWRRQFFRVTSANGSAIFARVDPERDAADR